MSAADPESPVSCQARTNVNLVNNPSYSGLFVVSDNNLGRSLLPTCTTEPWPTRDPQMSSCNQVYYIKKWTVAGVCAVLKWTLPLHGNSDEEIKTYSSTMSTAELLTLVLRKRDVTEWIKVDWSLISCFYKKDMGMQLNWKEKHLMSIKKDCWALIWRQWWQRLIYCHNLFPLACCFS